LAAIGTGRRAQHLLQPDIWAQIKDLEPYDAFRAVFTGWRQPLEWDEDFINASLYFEAKTFLHGLFVVEDKISMAHSLETRVPFLDNDLVDFAVRVPPRYKLHNLRQMVHVDENESGKLRRYQARASNDGKVILRQAMSQIVPPEITQRPKQGFSAPTPPGSVERASTTFGACCWIQRPTFTATLMHLIFRPGSRNTCPGG